MEQLNLLQDSILKLDILVWRVLKLFIKNKKRILTGLDLTFSQFEILLAIYYLQNVKPEVIQIDLSEKTSIDPMTTSTVLRNLQKKGLIIRKRSTVNTRTITVGLTTKGIKLLEKAYQHVEASNKVVYRGINKKQLMLQLAKLSEKLNKLNY